MSLKLLLPFRIFAEKSDVSRVVVETRAGSFGLLPHRRDGVAALAPGILMYETQAEGEAYVAVDEGILIKTGLSVLISVRRAVAGADLHELRDSVVGEFEKFTEHEQSVRAIMAKLEGGFLRRLASFQHE